VILCQSGEEAQQALCHVRGEGFDFLGYRFERGHRFVCRKSLLALRDKVRSKTKRSCGKSMAMIIADLNPMLRGWFEYFKHAHRRTFRPIDGFIRRRLRAIRRKQIERPGMGRCYADHLRWSNVYFAERGLYIMTIAHALASQSR